MIDRTERALTEVRRAIDAATKAERKRCFGLALEAHRERRSSGDPEGADVIWDLAQAIQNPPTVAP